MPALPFTIHMDAIPDLPPNAEVALALARDGLAVFPVQPSGPNVKRPYLGFRWRQLSTTDEVAILQFWERWPDALPALDLAKCGQLVVDAERHRGPDGGDAWTQLARKHGFDGAEHPRVDTPRNGRHFYFRQPDGPPLGNRRRGLPAGIDVRGAGGFTIGPGAVMPDGRRYTGHGPHICDAPSLPAWLRNILCGSHDGTAEAPPVAAAPAHGSDKRLTAYAAAALAEELSRVRGAGSGTRNNTLNAAAFAIGQMVGAGWLSEADVRPLLIDAARDCGLVEDDGMPPILKTIASGLRAGRAKPRAEPEDKQAVETARGAEIARRLIETAGGDLVDEATGEIVHEPQRRDAHALPDELTRVPGLVGDIVDWIEATARRPSRVLALGAAITVVGTAVGRRLAGPTMSGTHLYVLCLMPTGAGKDHGLQQVRRLLGAAKMTQHIGPDEFMSMPALVNFMVRAPLSVCPMDEFGGFLRRINGKRASGFETSITRTLRTAWGVNFGSMSTPEWAGRASQNIHAPALSIYAASTMEEFYAALEGADIVNGFLNRFLCLTIDRRPPEVEPRLPTLDVPRSIADRLEQLYIGGNPLLAAQRNIADRPVGPVEAPWTDDAAKATYRELVREVERVSDAEPERAPFLGRTAEMAVRLATIRATGIRPVAPAVTAADMQWGREVALWSANAMMVGADSHMAETEAQADANRILRIVRESGGRLIYRDLLRRLNHRMKGRDLQDVLKNLEDSGALQIEVEALPTGGHPRKWLILADEI